MSIEYFIKNTVEQIISGCAHVKAMPPESVAITIKATPDGNLCRNDEPTGIELKFSIGINVKDA